MLILLKVFCNDYEVRFPLDPEHGEDACIRALRDHGGFTPAYDKEACLRQIKDEFSATIENDATEVLEGPMSTMRLDADKDAEP